MKAEKFDKRKKMFGEQVVLPKCPKCGQNAVAAEIFACLKCDWTDPKVWTKDDFIEPKK